MWPHRTAPIVRNRTLAVGLAHEETATQTNESPQDSLENSPCELPTGDVGRTPAQMHNKPNPNEQQPEAKRPRYINLKQVMTIAGVSRSHAIRNIVPRLTRFDLGPRCVRFREDEVFALLESMGGAA